MRNTLPGQFGQIARVQIALPDLHQFDALRDPMGDMSQPASLVLRKASVCNQAANHWIGLSGLNMYRRQMFCGADPRSTADALVGFLGLC